MSATPGGTPGEARQRGPVEEVIAKRMRQLGKKLQRIKTYASQPESSLNADQKATLMTLPALEGAYKELEDLIREKGPVDEQELIQAARLREAQNAAKKQASSESKALLEAYKTSLSKTLPLFFRLHSLLHPARPSDHEHLTFGHLELPVRLQDEVQATDILRVGRMWEDLRQEETAKSVLECLANGPSGTDEENDHVHHLMNLLSQPEPIHRSSSPALVNTAPSEVNTADTAEQSTLVADVPSSIASAPYGASKVDVETPNGHAEEPKASGGMINFLQDDELDENEAAAGGASSEHDFELVPMLEPHQTSGFQPVIEEPPTKPTTPDLPSSTQTTAAAQFAPATTQDWSELDDQHDVLMTSFSTPKIDENPSTFEPAKELPSQTPIEATLDESSTSQAPPAVTSEPSQETATTKSTVPAPSKSPLSPNKPKNQNQGQNARKASGQNVKPQAKKEPSRKTVVDEDGFEMKVRRAPAPTPQRGRGRGDFRGGNRGGRGGNGNARGGGQAGRGGSNGQKNASQNGGPNEGGQGGKKGVVNGQSQANGTKASIYKS